VHTILDEIVMGGMVLETNCHEVLRSVGEITKCALTLPSSLRGAHPHHAACPTVSPLTRPAAHADGGVLAIAQAREGVGVVAFQGHQGQH
jgi:hypothetical protein